MINIRTALNQAVTELSLINADARLDAELLMGHVLNKNRAYIFAHPEQALTQTQLDDYHHLITARAKGMPIAYLIGYREFWSLTLKVNAHTLIPRHETERLVELTLELLADTAGAYILDLGTGSGAIALALATERPDWNISACDYSLEALAVAKENADTLSIKNINFYHSDWFTNLPNQQYHAIISNPPYITEQDPHLQQGDLQFEPINALVSSQEGLADLQYIIQQSYNRLLPNGMILLEHGFDQKVPVNAILNRSGYRNVQCWQDIQGHDRVSGGWRP